MTVRVSATETPVAALDGTVSAIASARRAVLADRYPVDSLTVEWRIFTELASIVPEWRKLSACALEPNVFYLQGFSGHGMSLTGLGGKLVAEAIAGTAERFDVFSRIPHRDFPGGPLLRRPSLVLAMLYYRLRDLL